ncbi:MAG: nucleotidyltransferase domain-containing protein [Archaeoglobaceae archaeon]|nr:nucleotidyltransferase domain-containing protein [Archaeoglobaceae archaeon]MDW7989885.1 nucleotidyltransferase domain-containing protein [Archaeoglobaceae archaeon]
MRPIRLRDFVRIEDMYFSVLGYNNYEKVKCFLRYSPRSDGDRVKDGKRFKKLTHEEAIMHKFAVKYFDGKIFRIPNEEIEEVFKPEERLKDVMDSRVLKIVNFFSSIPVWEMGVTGSRLIGLHENDSDVDFVVYGNWWFLAREKLKKGIEIGKILELDESFWDFIYEKRKVNIPFNVFVVHEKRKFHRAFLGDTYFDLLYVRAYEEIDNGIPEEPGKKIGKRIISAVVTDDRYIFDYPAYYPLDHDIRAILCFTHTFVGQAFKGERVVAKGEIEIIEGEKYLVVGTKREVEDEFIISLDLLEKEQLKEEVVDLF